jgi:hypothetical protein
LCSLLRITNSNAVANTTTTAPQIAAFFDMALSCILNRAARRAATSPLH